MAVEADARLLNDGYLAIAKGLEVKGYEKPAQDELRRKYEALLEKKKGGHITLDELKLLEKLKKALKK